MPVRPVPDPTVRREDVRCKLPPVAMEPRSLHLSCEYGQTAQNSTPSTSHSWRPFDVDTGSSRARLRTAAAAKIGGDFAYVYVATARARAAVTRALHVHLQTVQWSLNATPRLALTHNVDV